MEEPSKRTRTRIKILFTLAILALLFVPSIVTPASSESPTAGNLVRLGAYSLKSQPILSLEVAIEAEILKSCHFYGVDCDLAMDLARHESQLNPYARNREGSSAKGIYQFIDSTWADHCEGDVFSYYQNIDCAIRLISEGGITHWYADQRVYNHLHQKGHIN